MSDQPNSLARSMQAGVQSLESVAESFANFQNELFLAMQREVGLSAADLCSQAIEQHDARLSVPADFLQFSGEARFDGSDGSGFYAPNCAYEVRFMPMPTLICFNCRYSTSQKLDVANRFCPKCRKFLHPDAPNGRVKTVEAPDAVEVEVQPGSIIAAGKYAMSYQSGSASFTDPAKETKALLQSRGVKSREEMQAQADALDASPFEFPRGYKCRTINCPPPLVVARIHAMVHMPGDSMPLLSAIARHFEIDSFPADSMVHVANTRDVSTFIVCGAIVDGQRVKIIKRNHETVLDSAALHPSASAWAVHFSVDRKLFMKIMDEACDIDGGLLHRKMIAETENVDHSNPLARQVQRDFNRIGPTL